MKQFIVLLLLSSAAFAQGGAYAGSPVINGVGQPIANASIAISTANPCGTAPTYANCNGQSQGIYTGTLPPASPASLFTDIVGTNTVANPLLSDPLGNWTVYATPGVYWATVYGYQIVPQVQIIVVSNASGGGGGTINPCGSANSNAYYLTASTNIFCDQFFTDDGAGHPTAKSIGLTDPTFSGFFYLTQGPAPAVAAVNSIYFYAPVSVSSYAWILPGSAGTGCLQAANASGLVTISFTGVACGSGSGATLQTNGSNNSSQVLLNFVNSPTVTASNPSGGIEQFSIVGAGQLSNPTAPTVTPTGTPGGTQYCYLIVGVEGVDSRQANGIFSSTATSATCTNTGNATLTTSNYNAITAYGSSLYGYRGFIVCRTTGGSTQGVITGTAASPTYAGKSFNDTGLSADGTNCASAYATNNTYTGDYCLGSPLPGSPSVPGAPCGIDAPPLLPNTQDDEMGATFGAPADVNDPFWTWLHQSVATATWTGGMISLQMANQATNQLSCLTQALPSAPYRFNTLVYPSTFTAAGAAQPVSVGFYESATGKLLTFDILTGLSLQQSHWTNTTTYGATVGGPSNALVGLPINIQWGRDGSNNISFWHSQDGVQYAKDYTETVTSFFTTAPDTLAICINPHNSGTGTLIVDYDYFRVKNLAPGVTF